jgi:hypothetical protein
MKTKGKLLTKIIQFLSSTKPFRLNGPGDRTVGRVELSMIGIGELIE